MQTSWMAFRLDYLSLASMAKSFDGINRTEAIDAILKLIKRSQVPY